MNVLSLKQKWTAIHNLYCRFNPPPPLPPSPVTFSKVRLNSCEGISVFFVWRSCATPWNSFTALVQALLLWSIRNYINYCPLAIISRTDSSAFDNTWQALLEHYALCHALFYIAIWPSSRDLNEGERVTVNRSVPAVPWRNGRSGLHAFLRACLTILGSRSGQGATATILGFCPNG